MCQVLYSLRIPLISNKGQIPALKKLTNSWGISKFLGESHICFQMIITRSKMLFSNHIAVKLYRKHWLNSPQGRKGSFYHTNHDHSFLSVGFTTQSKADKKKPPKWSQCVPGSATKEGPIVSGTQEWGVTAECPYFALFVQEEFI